MFGGEGILTQSSAQDLTKFFVPGLRTQGRFPDFPTVFKIMAFTVFS